MKKKKRTNLIEGRKKVNDLKRKKIWHRKSNNGDEIKWDEIKWDEQKKSSKNDIKKKKRKIDEIYIEKESRKIKNNFIAS